MAGHDAPARTPASSLNRPTATIALHRHAPARGCGCAGAAARGGRCAGGGGGRAGPSWEPQLPRMPLPRALPWVPGAWQGPLRAGRGPGRRPAPPARALARASPARGEPPPEARGPPRCAAAPPPHGGGAGGRGGRGRRAPGCRWRRPAGPACAGHQWWGPAQGCGGRRRGGLQGVGWGRGGRGQLRRGVLLVRWC